MSNKNIQALLSIHVNPDRGPNSLEGKEPKEFSKTIRQYKDQEYRITKHGHVLSLKGQVMKAFYYPNKRGQRVRIKKEIQYSNGSHSTKYEELVILKAMSDAFGSHFPGYSNFIKNPKAYILVPCDGDYDNMDRSNLQYVSKKIYHEKLSNKGRIKELLEEGKAVKEIVKDVDISQVQVFKIREEFREEGGLGFDHAQKRRAFKKENNIECSLVQFPMYELFLKTKGELSNLEMAKILFPEEYSKADSNEKKKSLTNSIVRVRKRLQDQGKIPRDTFQEKRDQALQLLTQKEVSGHTNQQIAEILGLKKQQIDNLARKIKKQSGRK